MPIPHGSRVASSRPWRSRLLVTGSVYLILTVGLLITVVMWYATERTIERNTQAYFNFRVNHLMESIDKRLETYQQVLYGARGLFAASDAVERGEFREYISAMHLDQRYPGIQGVGFSVIVPKDKKDSHIRNLREQGFPDYQIYPPGERESYTSIIYLEPFAGRNLRAFSYDMFSEPVRRQAMIFARDNNSIGLSGKVTLVQETDSDIQFGFLMYLPVYRNGQPVGDEQQRRANIIGWVYAPFRIKDFMAGIGGERAGDLHLSIYDDRQASQSDLMYSDHNQQISEQALSTTRQLSLGGRTWTLVIHSEPGLQHWLSRYHPLIILVNGVILSLLLALLMRQLIAHEKALSLAAATNHELQESEARFRLMADSAPVMIWMADVDQSAIWFNKHWLDFTGRTLTEETGHGWLVSVDPAQLELVGKLLNWHFQLHKPFSVEFRLRRFDGEYRWIINTGVPRFDENTNFVGFIGSCIDITQHKRMEEELWELATTDGLTGFFNRRHFLVRLQEEFNRMQRNAELESAVLMLDLDYFKRINDTHGHAAGDAVLKHFADIIRRQQRKIDVVGRLGGEEFAIILPDTDLSEARVFAERLRKTLADSPLRHQNIFLEVTVSIGIALLTAGSKNPDSVLSEADRALYSAKEGGRNRVVLSPAQR
ncbi:CHASE domain-containing protein [Methylomonas sp. LL1]|uniref:CHASE domain-containing protein n=1 Tax=Methylomonas sp. LL1 TaxID=2785785 RepID=UPI0018C3AEFC|nr:CHASE domain-containing protein [Methylomonas sp. LL1]QPK64571.1 CHASE domain-containing protein [Methylomonas sp. LL1]